MPTQPRAPRSRRSIRTISPSPALPHERDEAPEIGGGRRAVVKQAAKDIARGLVDTDNYTRAREVTLSRRRRSR